MVVRIFLVTTGAMRLTNQVNPHTNIFSGNFYNARTLTVREVQLLLIRTVQRELMLAPR